jgi:hypothetical protein
MNKLFLLILILGLIIFYCLKHNLENFAWAWGYFQKIRKMKYDELYKNLPRGDWINTCNVEDFRDPMLWALCQDDRGKYVETSINIDKCFDRKIRNVKGILECD